MIAFLRTRPWLSVLVLAAAVSLPLVANRTDSSAQSSGKSCAAIPVGAIVKSKFSTFDPTKQTGIYIWPRSAIGDQYLQQLNGGASPSGNLSGVNTSASGAPKAPVSFASAMASLTTQFQNQANLKVNLQSLYASMYSVQTDANDFFQCAGLPAGQYSVLSIVQQKPGVTPSPIPIVNPKGTATFVVPDQGSAYSTVSKTGGFNVPSQSQAATMLAQQHRIYYYSWTIVKPKDTQPVVTPTPKKGTAAAPPTFAPVSVARFQPISAFPSGYFGARTTNTGSP